uniref:Endoplasmic reticulum lectin 1 n=1 Tax=Ditylenchus dipsaci TaxID=166011 RepID=A0A915E7L6_9BILA
MRFLIRHTFWVLPLLIFVIASASELDYLRALDDFIAYRVSFKPQEEEEKYVQSSEKDSWVSMKSADAEEYRCLLPTIQSSTKKRIETYSGPTPAELLQPIYDDNVCSYRIESYWLYELCHGRYLLQYHDEKETKTRVEYYLGHYAKFEAEAEAKTFDQLNPPTRKVGEEMLPYYPVTYVSGTVCDLTNKPRETTVLYVCDETAKNNVQSFNEVSSCKYEIVVLTNRLCAHPSFQKPPTKEHEIHCFAVDAEQLHPKPKNLIASEKENTNQFFQEFSLLKSSSLVSSTKNIFDRLMQVSVDETDDEFDQLNLILQALKANAKQAVQPTPQSNIQTPLAKLETPSPSDQQLVEQFWQGKACLSGGSGWWKYEICYGRSVVQFHEEPGKERVNVVLGVFHEKLHRDWATTHPHKAVKKDNGHVYQVGNLYTQGDLCAETDAHRSCEVRMRCREPVPGVSPSKVLIYLLEPDTCSYILVVESTLLCDGLQHVDDAGVLKEMPQLQQFETLHEPRTVSSKEHSSKVQIIKDENLATLAASYSSKLKGDDGVVEEEDDEDDDDESQNDEQQKNPSATSQTAMPYEDMIKEVRRKFANFQADKAKNKGKPQESEENVIVGIVQGVVESFQEGEDKPSKNGGDEAQVNADQKEVITELLRKFAKLSLEMTKQTKKESVQSTDSNQPTQESLKIVAMMTSNLTSQHLNQKTTVCPTEKSGKQGGRQRRALNTHFH